MGYPKSQSGLFIDSLIGGKKRDPNSSMDITRLNSKNFLLYAMKHYDNSQCTGIPEFVEDINRIKYIRKLLTIYVKNGDLKERLVLNHLIPFYNVFPTVPATKMLFYKLPAELHCALKTFLLFMNYMPEKSPEIEVEVDTASIPIDLNIAKRLRQI